METEDVGDVQVEDVAPEPTPEPAPASNAPWAQELASTFADDSIRSQVDEFLRGQIQPYVTKLEQESVQNRDANRLWNDFAEDPYDTYVGVTKELFGDEVALKIASALEADDEPDYNPEENDVSDIDPLAIDEDELPDSVRSAVEYFQQQQQEAAWAQEMARIQEENPDLEIDEKLFDPFVVAADGNFDVAVAGYEDFVNTAKQKFGLEVGDLSSVDAGNAAPAVIDSSSSAPSTPPQQQSYESLDDAMDAFFAEQNAPPPVVGSS